MESQKDQNTSERCKILIIDDEILVSKTIGDILQIINSIVLYADKGSKAIEILKSESVDLIILDGLLPDMDGFQVAMNIRNMINGKDVPIIMMSGIYKKMKYQYQAKEAGINAFIPKPVSIDPLLKEIRKLLNKDNA